MKTKKLLSILLTLSLLASLLCLSALPAAAAEVSDWDALSAALAAGGAVVLTADVTVPADRALAVPADVSATLDLAGFAITHASAENTAYPLYVAGDLTLTDSVGGGSVAGVAGGISVSPGGTLTLTGGTVSCTSTVEEADGYVPSAVAVWADAALTIAGGTLSSANGAGVYLFAENSAAAMTGGRIADSAVGVIVDRGGSFTLSGGEIADSAESGVEICVGAVTMTGGAITGCGGSGVILYYDSSVFTMTGGAISGSVGSADLDIGWYDNGAGVELWAGSAEIAGGEISDSIYGISLYGGSVKMTGGTVRDQRAVWVERESQMLFGGSGVELDGGSFTMTGGTVADNEICGVRNGGAGVVEIAGGTISGCAYPAVLHESDGTLTLSGSPVFADNAADVALGEGKIITVGGPLTLAAPLAVVPAAAALMTSPTLLLTSGLDGNGSAADFTSHIPDYRIVAVDGEAWAVYFPDYPDVSPDDWYASPVGYTTFYGIFEGTDKGFEPQLEMTNAMAVQAVWRYELDHAPSDVALPFDDVDADAWYAEALRWAVSEGLVDAEQASFRPDEPITREDLCVLCYRFARTYGLGFEGLWSFKLDFPDAADVSPDALEAMSWFVMTGVINGMDGTLNPKGTATRAQTATILMRLSNVFWSQAALT